MTQHEPALLRSLSSAGPKDYAVPGGRNPKVGEGLTHTRTQPELYMLELWKGTMALKQT